MANGNNELALVAGYYAATDTNQTPQRDYVVLTDNNSRYLRVHSPETELKLGDLVNVTSTHENHVLGKAALTDIVSNHVSGLKSVSRLAVNPLEMMHSLVEPYFDEGQNIYLKSVFKAIEHGFEAENPQMIAANAREAIDAIYKTVKNPMLDEKSMPLTYLTHMLEGLATMDKKP